MNRFFQRLSLLICLSATYLFATAQVTIDFSALTTGTSYSPPAYQDGDFIFELEDVYTTIGNFVYDNGNSDLLEVRVDDFNSAPIAGNALWISNATTIFDFADIPGTVNRVRFDFWDGGGSINLRLNSGELLLLEDLTDAPNSLGPGIASYTIEMLNDVQGTMTINGSIDSLRIGGQEFYLDNLYYETVEDCEISNIVVETYGCDAEENFLVDFSFDYEFSQNTFNVFLNNLYQGTFTYGEDFYTVGPVPGNTDYVLTIAPQFNNCVGTLAFEGPACDNSGYCNMSNPQFGTVECDNNGAYISFDFDYVNPSDSFYISYGDDTMAYSYNALPIQLGPIAENDIGIQVWDRDTLGCDLSAFIGAIDCDSNNDCIDFSALVPGTSYFNDLHPGDLLLHEDGVSVTLGSSSFSSIEVVDDPFCGPFNAVNGTHIFMLGFLDFNFSNLNTIPNTVSFDFHTCDPGGEFSINGNDFFDIYYPDQTFVLLDLGNGYSATVSRPALNQAEGTVTISGGPIELLTLSGAELAIDNVCFENSTTNCEITDLVVENLGCTGVNTVGVIIDFEYDNAANDLFDVFDANGAYVGSYALANLPVTIDNLPVNFNSNGLVTVCINDTPDCCATAEFDIPVCNFYTEVGECTPNGVFPLLIFSDQELAPGTFTLFVNGEVEGEYTYGNPVTLVLPGEGQLVQLQFVDNDNGDFTIINVVAPECPILGECFIGDLVLEQDCDGDISYGVLNFEYENTSDSFNVVYANEAYTFPYSSLPIVLSPLPDEVFTISVFDEEDDGCSSTQTFDFIDCTSDCAITNLVADFQQCSGNATYSVVINFEYENVTNDFFDLFDANGNLVGFYALSDLPITVQNFPASSNAFDQLTVCINDAPNCCATAEFQVEACINPFSVDDGECNPNGNYIFNLISDQTAGNGTFNLTVDDEDYGLFDYGATVQIIVPGEGQTVELVMTDSNTGNVTVIFVTAIDCTAADCTITDFIIEYESCNDDGTINVVVNFNHQNATNDLFDVLGPNGNIIGTYALADLPVLVENVPADNNINVQILTVCINDTPNCCATNEFEHPDCFSSCDVTLTANAGSCNPNGIFTLTGIAINNGNDGAYTLSINGDGVGTYLYDEAFSLDLPGNGQVLVLTTQDTDDPNCGAVFTVEAPDCDNNDCQITDLSVEYENCNDDGTINVVVNFNHQNATNDLFDVFGPNGNIIGTYALADLPVFVEGVPANNNTNVQVLSVCINDNPNCCSITEFEHPDCFSSCDVTLTANAGSCNPNGIFTLTGIATNNGNDGAYTLSINGDGFGTFLYDETFEIDLPGEGQTLVLTTQDTDDPNCGNIFTVLAPNCDNSNCQISNFIIDYQSCNDDGTINVVVNFNHQDATNDLFDVLGPNGDIIGTYALADLPVLVENVPADNNINVQVLTVCINDSPNCCATNEFEHPDCFPTCDLSLSVTTGPCNPNNVFTLIGVASTNGVSDTYTLDINGEIYGTYAYDETFEIDLIGEGQVLVLTALDTENPNCAEILTVIAPDCDNQGDCFIGELQLDFSCDGGVYGPLNFEYENTSDSFILITNNGTSIHLYEDLPIDLGPLPGDGITPIFISVFDYDNDNCEQEIELEPINCNDVCIIEQYSVTVGECVSNTSFEVVIDFELFESETDIFNVIDVMGNNLGTFNTSELPVTVEVEIPTNLNFQNISVLVENTYTECIATETIDLPDCSDIEDCFITNLIVETYPCEDGVFFVDLDFQYENTSDSFVVYIENEIYGTYAYTDLFLTLGPLSFEEDEPVVFEVWDQEAGQNCLDIFTILPPNCEEDCEIGNINLVTECDGDVFFVGLDFEYANVDSDGFEVVGNGNNYGTFAYNDLPIVLGPFDDDAGTVLEFGVSDLNNPNCGNANAIEAPECGNGDCEIGEVGATAICDGDVFFVELNFEYANVSNAGFGVVGNGNDYGEFSYDDLPILLGPFDNDPGSILEFIAIDLVNDDCQNFGILEAPDCGSLSSCIEFEGLNNGQNYGAPYTEPGDLIHIENGVYITAEGIELPGDNLEYGFLFATNQDVCDPFDNAVGNRMFMLNGLRFDFAELNQQPDEIVLDYHSCGIPFGLSVNDISPVTLIIPSNDQTFALPPDILVEVITSSDEEGQIRITGNVSSVFIGGAELQVDNICFNVNTELTDVWPGDVDYNNTANNYDLLHIGIAYGSSGPERTDMTEEWEAMNADNWDQTFADGETNFKHADTNGDGVVDIDDRNAIDANYGLTRGSVPVFVPYPGTPNDPPLFVDLPEAEDIILGEAFEAPIVFGSDEIPVEEVYGLAFTIRFDPTVINPDDIILEFGDSWLGNMNEDLIKLEKSFAQDGFIDVALTRINQENKNGHGTIGYVIGIIDDILGKEVEVEIINVRAIDVEQTPVPIYNYSETVDLSTSTQPELVEQHLDIFPNPTDEWININYDGPVDIQALKVYNALGQIVADIKSPAPQTRIDVQDWSSGIYFIKVELPETQLTKKIEVIRQ